MQGGDSLVGEGWYHENITIPMPGSSTNYYIFSIGVTGTSQLGLYYSIVDLSLNGGLGAVVVRNIQLSNLQAFDGIASVKHGNGRDWWLVFKTGGQLSQPSNIFYIYLISPSGISPPVFRAMGEIINNNAGSISFSKAGNKMLLTSWNQIIEVCDFDRCSALFSNITVIEQEATSPTSMHFSSCFSPSGDLIYVTHIPYFVSDSVHYLFQYNLLAGNIAASRDTIYYTYHPNELSGICLAPDDKIYVTSHFDCGSGCFPYPDSVYNTINMTLSVINSPDSLGSVCNFQPNSFYLGGKRAYFGLPNNPDYELGPEVGSQCDSLFLSVSNPIGIEEINVYPNPFFNKVTLHPARISNAEILIEVFNSSGEKVFHKTALCELQDLDLSDLPKGIYILKISGNRFVATSKLVKL